MRIIDKINEWAFGATADVVQAPIDNQRPSPMASYYPNGTGTYNHLFSMSFNGEKNLGEIGPIRSYELDHPALRLRSWQAYLESEVAQTVINKYVKWTIGSGLKCQSEPNENVLAQEGINISDKEAFTELIESRWAVFANASMSDYADMTSLQTIAYKAKLNAILAGDVLVIIRYIDNVPKYQLVDAAHICSPLFSNKYYEIAAEKGHKIKHGIELDGTGRHIAFYVKRGLVEFDRIEARSGATGLISAFMVYGLEYRLDDVRGIPLITVVMEKLKKMERYSEAVLGSAEERQKIAIAIEHQAFSDGSNPYLENMAKMIRVDSAVDDVPTDINGKILQQSVAATTNKQVINLPVGATLKSLESKNELYFKDFYSVNIDLVCAALGIPPNVAMSKYDANFSASRAALKDWEYTLIVDRKQFAVQFYKPCFNYWFEVQVLSNKIQAPGYLQARMSKNYMVVEAYRTCRWVGANVPHIDPMKEVNAERAKLGITADAIPLTTVEAATEALNGGDSKANMQQFSKELDQSKKLGVIIDQSTPD